MAAFVEMNGASVIVFYKDKSRPLTVRSWRSKDAKAKAELFAKEQAKLDIVDRIFCKSSCVIYVE